MMKSSILRSLHSALSRGSTHLGRRGYATEPVPERKVAILGAAGGIGQPLSLLMKLNLLVSSLSLYDIAGTPGVAADVSHINTRSEVVGYQTEGAWESFGGIRCYHHSTWCSQKTMLLQHVV